MNTNLANKNILVTAGPTWVPIDKVRVITNIFSGRLGYAIAKIAAENKAKVTLLLGPGRIFPENPPPNLKIARYKYFDEILSLMENEIKSQQYDIVIHSAAIADYAPEAQESKIKSGKKELLLELKPTLKIVDQIKKWDPKIFLVKFKLEVGISEKELLDIAYKSMIESKADLMVANEFSETSEKHHRAFIINPQKEIKTVIGKENIAAEILNEIKLTNHSLSSL